MANFDTQRQKAFDFCADATKQLITLSTGIIAFMVTFAKDFVTNVPGDIKLYAYIAWVLHGLSILSGIVTLLALTAELQPKQAPTNGNTTSPSIRGAAATYSGLQIMAFVLAIFFTVFFGIKAARSQSTPTPVQPVIEQPSQNNPTSGITTR